MSAYDNGAKVCGGPCGLVLPLAAYWRKASARDGLQTWCKPCLGAQNERWAGENPERRRRAQNRSSRRRKYGLTHAEIEALLLAQGGVCAICAVDAPGGRWNQWAVDHCHETAVVRGVLCNDCNAGMGILKDDPVRLRACADYLERTTP